MQVGPAWRGRAFACTSTSQQPPAFTLTIPHAHTDTGNFVAAGGPRCLPHSPGCAGAILPHRPEVPAGRPGLRLCLQPGQRRRPVPGGIPEGSQPDGPRHTRGRVGVQRRPRHRPREARGGPGASVGFGGELLPRACRGARSDARMPSLPVHAAARCTSPRMAPAAAPASAWFWTRPRPAHAGLRMRWPPACSSTPRLFPAACPSPRATWRGAGSGWNRGMCSRAGGRSRPRPYGRRFRAWAVVKSHL